MIQYKITQHINGTMFQGKGIYNNKQTVIFEHTCERIAKNEFKRLNHEFPAEHFELFKIEHNQECLDWSGKPWGISAE